MKYNIIFCEIYFFLFLLTFQFSYGVISYIFLTTFIFQVIHTVANETSLIHFFPMFSTPENIHCDDDGITKTKTDVKKSTIPEKPEKKIETKLETQLEEQLKRRKSFIDFFCMQENDEKNKEWFAIMRRH